MKKLILILLSIMLFSCSTTKQVNKEKALETSNTVTDSSTCRNFRTVDSTTKTDSSITTTIEHITTTYQPTKDSAGNLIPATQVIDRKITEKKAVKEQSLAKTDENKKTDLNKKEKDKKQADTTNKTIVKTGFTIP
eukprot:TRINITY_DN1750_c0_g1_i2.p2 TRINITY_DN1750_c0_g1~~TRINITY_DN1750_c0_g1_i2.p2  ORF type:complete len:136 (+),score=6.02 TRINITY_DN1750_c0_g1_i2:555-962(+)